MMKKQLLIAGIVLLSGCINEPPKAQTKHRVLTEPAPSEVPSIDAKYQKMVSDSIQKWRSESRVLHTLVKLRAYHTERALYANELFELDTDIQELAILIIFSGGDAYMRDDFKKMVTRRNMLIETMNALGFMVKNQDSIYLLTAKLHGL